MCKKRLIDILSDADNYLKTISNMSKNQDTSLVESEILGIDFDAIKDDYFKSYNCTHPSTSNDSVINYKDSDYFIEFKDQKKPNTKEIREKIRNSLLIYLDKIDEKISYARHNLGYILVYNPNKQENYNRLKESIGSLTQDRFGLKKDFEGLYFKEVICIPADKFKEKLMDNSIIKSIVKN